MVDLTAPAATTITVDAVTQDTGLSDSDFITSDNQITLNGTLGAALGRGEHAQISIDGGTTWIDVNVSGLTGPTSMVAPRPTATTTTSCG